jgi:hypothetical protein
MPAIQSRTGYPPTHSQAILGDGGHDALKGLWGWGEQRLKKAYFSKAYSIYTPIYIDSKIYKLFRICYIKKGENNGSNTNAPQF